MPSKAGEGGSEGTRSFKVMSPGTMISHYKIIEKIGEGGMGVVYKALDTKLDRTVALKFLPARLLSDVEAKTRFEHEAKSASALSHNNITTIHEIDEVEGRSFIVMEYVDGKSIEELIKESSLSLDEIVDISLQIERGLDAAHKKGVVHRDIKSDNIMVSADGVVKIMDFGLAKLKGVTKLTKEGTTIGTLQYMSPEQLQGRKIDQRSDIFSSGVVLYEMITGHLPFRGEDEAAVIHSILNETPEPLARYKTDVPDSLQRIVDKALSKDKEERYQHADEVVADLRREKHPSERIATARISTGVLARPPKRRYLPILVPVAAACIIALLIFVFEPFRVEMGPRKEAMARENSLAIMYFENVVDPEDNDKTGRMITSLLITDLSESQYLRVVSSQRLYDILKFLGKEDQKTIDKNIASEIAQEARVKWVLTGNILRSDPPIVLTSEVSDAATGEVLATQRATGGAGEDLFSVVDRLSAQIRADLTLPDEAKHEADRAVADVTTHSPEAYRYYLQGLDYEYKLFDKEVKDSYRKALEFDSTFAMAYFRLSRYLTGPERKAMIGKAVKYIDRVSEKEKHWIRAQSAYVSWDSPGFFAEIEQVLKLDPEEKEAYYFRSNVNWELGKIQQAIADLRAAVEIDPLWKVPYNDLSYAYHRIGDFDNSIWAINKYISLAPDEPNPYDSRGDLYAYNGKLDEAMSSYREALSKKPDFWMSAIKLGHMHLFRKEYEEAQNQYRKLASSDIKETRARGRLCLSLIPIRRGKLDAALEILDNGIAADEMEQVVETEPALKHFLKAIVCEAKNDFGLALREVETARDIVEPANPDNVVGYRPYHTYLLAQTGSVAEAQEIAVEMKRRIEETDPSLIHWYWLSLGFIEMAKGKAETAVTYLERIDDQTRSEFCQIRLLLARAYLESGELSKAVAEFEKALSRYDRNRTGFIVWTVKARYQLGLAYEQSGWTDKAIEQYEEFLDIWKDADPGLSEIDDARQRLAGLKQAS